MFLLSEAREICLVTFLFLEPTAKHGWQQFQDDKSGNFSKFSESKAELILDAR